MKKFFTLAAAIVAACGIAANATDYYIIGEVNGGSWNYNEGTKMTEKSSGVYEITAEVKAGGYFGFAFGDVPNYTSWDDMNANRIYPSDGAQQVTLKDGKAEIEIGTEKVGGDSWTLGNSEAMDVTFTLDMNDYILIIDAGSDVPQDPNVYVRGDEINGAAAWGDPGESQAMTEVSTNVYEIKGITVKGGFKLANFSWSPVNVGAQEGTYPEMSVPFTAWNDGSSQNMVINNDAETTFSVNIKLDNTGSDPIVTVSVADGIEAVNVDANAPAVYYNLQGVKVENPANGLYIKCQGNNASKVYVK